MLILDDDWLYKLIEDLFEEAASRDSSDSSLSNAIYEAINAALPVMVDSTVNDIRGRSHEILTDQRCLGAEFAARLERRWFEALDLLELVIGSLSQIGEELNEKLRSTKETKPRHKIEIMTRIHARAARISREILCLVKNGYADGALARWRSLHELSAYQFFLLQSNDDTAKKFLHYIEIDSCREAEEYQEHADSLGYARLSQEELDSIIRTRESLAQRYGADFTKKYGWTKDILPPDQRNFKGIENHAGLAHLRPFYSMASRSIHSSPKGLLWDVGLLDKGLGNNPLLAGASNYGLADPSQNCAISFMQITTALLSLFPSATGMACIKAVGVLINEMSEKFIAVQENIEAEEGMADAGDRDGKSKRSV